MNIQDMKRHLSDFKECEFTGGVKEAIVEGASQEIGLPFPPQYKAFLEEFGAGYVSSEELIGLGGPSHLNVVFRTKRLRIRQSPTKFPLTMFPVSSDGYGNHDCIDTTKATQDGEFQVVEWLHDGGEEQQCRALADSYFGWLHDMLNDIRRLDARDGM